MPDRSQRFLTAIDQDVAASDSVVLRYRNAVRFEPDDAKDTRIKSLLPQTSLQEGLRIVELMRHRGVSIDVLDESSLMASGTLKSIDGCLAAARSLDAELEGCVFESGGNTGSALTLYGGNVDLETYFFVPGENLDLLDSAIFSRPSSHLIAVDDPGQVKPAAHAFAELQDLVRIPQPGWRFQASRLIGCYLLERALEGSFYDYMVQSISAAFGPIGIYQVLGEHLPEDTPLPSFIGIQQAANCPMYRAWRGEERDAVSQPIRSTRELLTRVMYDTAPQTYGTFDSLRNLLIDTGGDLDTLDHQEFADGLERTFEGKDLITILADAGIHIGLRDGEVLEKAGLIALLGTLKRIELGRIPTGQRVLVCLTGGTARPDGLVKPTHRIADASQVSEIALGDRSELEQPHG